MKRFFYKWLQLFMLALTATVVTVSFSDTKFFQNHQWLEIGVSAGFSLLWTVSFFVKEYLRDEDDVVFELAERWTSTNVFKNKSEKEAQRHLKGLVMILLYRLFRTGHLQLITRILISLEEKTNNPTQPSTPSSSEPEKEIHL